MPRTSKKETAFSNWMLSAQPLCTPALTGVGTDTRAVKSHPTRPLVATMIGRAWQFSKQVK